MTTKKRNFSFALAAAIAAMTLAPLSAHADAEGIFQRGQAGTNSTTDWVQENNQANAILDNKVLKATVGEGPQNEKTAGLVVKALGLRPLKQGENGWQSLAFRADLGTVSPSENVIAVLHFDLPNKQVYPKKVVYLSQFAGHPTTQAGWRTFQLSNSDLQGFGKDGLLKKVVILVFNWYSNTTRTIKIGKVNIWHSGQGGLDPEVLKLNDVYNTSEESDS